MKRCLVAFTFLMILVSCRGQQTPETQNGVETKGFTFIPVTQDLSGDAVTGVSYTVYCASTPRVGAGTTITSSLGESTTVYWENIPLPNDGVWFCAVTAKTSDFNESSQSAAIGVRLSDGVYYKYTEAL
jgi:hypothetical protein